MDIAEIRRKAKLLEARADGPANVPAAEIEEFTFPEETGTGSELSEKDYLLEESGIESIPEVEVMTDEMFNEVQKETFKPEPPGANKKIKPVEAQVFYQETRGQKNAEPETSSLQKQETVIAKETEESVKKEATPGEVEAIVFSLDNEEYGIDIHQVKEVIKVRELTDVPNAPKDIMGVISLRGVVLPVMNLRGRFGMPMKTTGERIIIVRDGAGLLGLIVDTVKNVVRVPEDSLEPPPSINTIDGDLIRGIGRYKGGMFILIDTQKMLELK